MWIINFELIINYIEELYATKIRIINYNNNFYEYSGEEEATITCIAAYAAYFLGHFASSNTEKVQ